MNDFDYEVLREYESFAFRNRNMDIWLLAQILKELLELRDGLKHSNLLIEVLIERSNNDA